jgi:hypothetical protein
MPTPFPGMDPYLERAGVWEEVHTRRSRSTERIASTSLRPIGTVCGFTRRPKLLLSFLGTWQHVQNIGNEEVVIAPRSPWQNPYVERSLRASAERVVVSQRGNILCCPSMAYSVGYPK